MTPIVGGGGRKVVAASVQNFGLPYLTAKFCTLAADKLHRLAEAFRVQEKQPGRYGWLLSTSPIPMKNAPQEYRSLLDALARCVAACEYCADACLHEDDIKMMVPCIRLDRDCADICRLTAAFIARGSDHAQHVIKECIEICQKCADECGKHQHDHCQQCAQACRECMEACKAYSE